MSRCLSLLPLLLLAAAAPAATLETAATVTLVAPVEAGLDHWRTAQEPAWTLAGAPDASVQVSVERRSPAGERVVVGDLQRVQLDGTGSLLAALPAPTADDDTHATAPVITLVVCRE